MANNTNELAETSPVSISIQFSGVKNDQYHDGSINKIDYIYIFNDPEFSVEGKTDYNSFLEVESNKEKTVMMINYEEDNAYSLENYQGVYYSKNIIVPNYSIYRREYEEYIDYNAENPINSEVITTYIGEWEPVIINGTEGIVRDFNVTKDRSYQYIIYLLDGTERQSFANFVSEETAPYTGKPVKTNWEYWSLAELIPQTTPVDTPSVKKTYKVDMDNIWFFKYSFEGGAQTQNIKKTEIETLGQFPKISHGQSNYLTGSVDCYLGSEIIPGSAEGYIERLAGSRTRPLSTNERAKMLMQWRAIIYSRNPKLLRDNKGQAWIVQIMDGSNTPHTFYRNQPDKIQFSWKQIDSVENMVIYGSSAEVECPGTLTRRAKPNQWQQSSNNCCKK